jgi:hypothetical protein
MSLSTSHGSAAGNALIKVTTLIAVVAAAIMVIVSVYGEAIHRRGQGGQPVVQPTVAMTSATTGYFDPCNVDFWGAHFSIQERMQIRKQCEEHHIR